MGDRKLEDISTEAPVDASSNGRGAVVPEGTATGEADAAVLPGAVSDSAPPAPATASPEEPVPDVSVSAEQFQALEKEKQELYDRLLRKQAEFDNFRKRTEREKIESYDFAVASFILGLLPALDGLERGLSVTEGETVESYKKGIELILKQLRDHLASAGVQPIRVIGTMFDPNFHQAVMREETALLLENEIMEEMQRGYVFKDRLLRPAMVKVAVAPAEAAATEAPAASAEAGEDESETVE
jgi:molecular chaperone GrpE